MACEEGVGGQVCWSRRGASFASAAAGLRKFRSNETYPKFHRGEMKKGFFLRCWVTLKQAHVDFAQSQGSFADTRCSIGKLTPGHVLLINRSNRLESLHPISRASLLKKTRSWIHSLPAFKPCAEEL